MIQAEVTLPPLVEVAETAQADLYKAGYQRMYDGLYSCRQQLHVMNEQNKVLYIFYLKTTGQKDPRFPEQ